MSGFAIPATARVEPEMEAAIAEAAAAVDAARESVYHLSEECDAYHAVSVARGRYSLLVTTANSPSGMGPEEMRGANQWATVIYDALNASAAAGISRDEVMGYVAGWMSDRSFPHDDPAFA